MVFSKNLWEFSVLSNLRWQNIHPNLFELLRGPAGARLHTTTTAQLLTFLGGLVVVVDEVSWTEKKGSKKNDSLYGKLRFSRDETCLVIKLRCYLRVEYVLLKTNMFANGWRLAITDFVRKTGRMTYTCIGMGWGAWNNLDGGFKYCFIFSPLGKWSILTHIFFRWVETANWIMIWWWLFIRLLFLFQYYWNPGLVIKQKLMEWKKGFRKGSEGTNENP